jgi:hypothetical protein
MTVFGNVRKRIDPSVFGRLEWLRRSSARLLIFGLGFSTAFASFPSGPFSVSPQSTPSSPKMKRNFLSWNFFDLGITGRLIVGYEHVFQIADRSYGLFAQYTSPQNYIFKGLLTTHTADKPTRDMFEFPSGTEFFVHFYGRRGLGAMKSFLRVGLSVLRLVGETKNAVYLPIGLGARTELFGNFHIMLTLSTLKLKITGSRSYNIVLVDPFAVMVEFNF